MQTTAVVSTVLAVAFSISVSSCSNGAGKHDRTNVASLPTLDEDPQSPTPSSTSLGGVSGPHAIDECIPGPSDKPDGASPKHTALRFGSNAPIVCDVPNLEAAGLYSFNAAAFVAAYPRAKKDLDELASLLREQPAELSSNLVPFVPFVDASWEYAVRVEYVELAKGSAMIFMGELGIEPDSLGQTPVQVVQALSNDRKTYVLGLFPTKISKRIKAFEINDAKETMDAIVARHASYRESVTKQLAELDADELSPTAMVVKQVVQDFVLTQ